MNVLLWGTIVRVCDNDMSHGLSLFVAVLGVVAIVFLLFWASYPGNHP